MKIIAGLSVIIAATSTLADTNVQKHMKKKSCHKTPAVFAGNSYNSMDQKFHGKIDLFKTFAHDSENKASNFIGLSNANIFINKRLGKNANVQINTQYGPISVVDTVNAASNQFQVTEAFVTYLNDARNTQFKVGKFFTAFATYNPYKADKTLAEERLSNLNNNAAELAYVINPASYVKVWAVKPNASAIKDYYGAKIGYSFVKNAVKVAADISMLNDAREMFQAPNGVTLSKNNAYNGQVVVSYGPASMTAKILKAPKLIDGVTKTPEIKGVALAYDLVVAGHNAKVIGEFEKTSNMDKLENANKRVAFMVKTPIDKKLTLVTGVSERSFLANARKLRTTSIGIEANI